MRNPPKEVMDTWPKPNYVDPERRGPGLLITQAILLTITTAFLFMRIYARVWITRARMGVDDIIVIISYFCAIALTVGIIVAVQNYGWETHIWDLPRDEHTIVMTRKISWISMIFYSCTSSFTKMSLLVFYLRILVAKIDKLITKITLACVVGYFIAILVVLFAQCQPLGHYWGILKPDSKGRCISEGVHMTTSATINLFLDIVIFLIPLRSLLILKIRTSQKLQVLGLFMCGILVVVAAAIRLYYVVVVMLKTYDVTWYGYMTWLFACAEAWIGLICACVPSCRAFFVSWNRGSLGSANRSRAMSHGYGPGTNVTASRRMSYGEDDVRGLTTHSSTLGTGNQTKIIGGDSVSISSEEYGMQHKGIQGLGGVRVQMEVLQYEEYDNGQRTPTSPRAEHMRGPTARR